MERLVFQYLIYDANYSSLFKKKLLVGFIYTMNLDEKTMQEWGYVSVLKGTENMVGRILKAPEDPEILYVTDTYQFDDYSKYIVTAFDEAHKARRRKKNSQRIVKKPSRWELDSPEKINYQISIGMRNLY